MKKPKAQSVIKRTKERRGEKNRVLISFRFPADVLKRFRRICEVNGVGLTATLEEFMRQVR